MKNGRFALHLVWIGVLFLVAAHTTGSIGSPNAVSAESVATAASSAAADVPESVPGQPADDFTPVACKMEPQCSTNTDCVAFCGPSGGHCVHSSCPIRICKCS